MPSPPPPPQLSPEMLAFLATQDRGPQLAGVMITGLVLSLIVITARFYTRLVIVRVTGVDDWFALISFVRLSSLLTHQFQSFLDLLHPEVQGKD